MNRQFYCIAVGKMSTCDKGKMNWVLFCFILFFIFLNFYLHIVHKCLFCSTVYHDIIQWWLNLWPTNFLWLLIEHYSIFLTLSIFWKLQNQVSSTASGGKALVLELEEVRYHLFIAITPRSSVVKCNNTCQHHIHRSNKFVWNYLYLTEILETMEIYANYLLRLGPGHWPSG